MFDVEEYFSQVDNRLRSCRDAKIYSDGPKVTPVGGWETWELIVWRASIEWAKHGMKLAVFDAWTRRRKKRIMRNFSYHFMRDEGACIFRLDTHGNEVPYSDPCHIHIGERTFEDGDADLRGLSLSELSFLDAFGWIHKHLKGKKCPGNKQCTRHTQFFILKKRAGKTSLRFSAW